ncbi:hypothetical protein OV090_42620 [Nannocystis sp. RBIL2]|uniref:cupin domain-containing protein n=1 Tax=Nannocystis sp. RBIL2 TaxID=2996788 RepID=UPI00226F210B|nr:hypothetical protein [Nannocystis sp. RBIL2]MCY1071514.1 hypothetical protein [Nannocystis sp. RBIL2]
MTTDTRHLSAFTLARTYVHLSNLGGASPVDVGEHFWEALMRRDDLLEGRLLGLFNLDQDSDHCEMHPAGDEILILLSGAIDVVFHEADGDRVSQLRGFQTCIVPQGVWHRVRVQAPSELIFITPGKGTETRPPSEHAS